MKVNFVYRGVDKSKALEYLIQEDFDKLCKINLDLQWSKVELVKDGDDFRVIIIVNTPSTELLACATNSNIKTAYYNAYAKLLGLVRKEKTKFSNKRRKKAYSKTENRFKIDDLDGIEIDDLEDIEIDDLELDE